MENTTEKILCPLVKTPTVPVCNPAELDELLAYIDSNSTPTADLRFKKGAISTHGCLDLCKQGVGVSGTQRLINVLEDNHFIKHILLGTDSLGDEGVSTLAPHINTASPIETVYLGCNLITEKGVQALASSLSNNSNVKSLWLKRNPLGDHGVIALSEMFSENKSLRTLDLVNTNMSNKGLTVLAQKIENGVAPLQALYLGGNQLDESCIEALLKILHVPTIKALFLNVNSLGDKFLNALHTNVCYGNKMIDLGLASNGLSEKGLKYIFESSEKLKFRSLDLGYSRSTKALAAKANFFGDTFGKEWRKWISEQKDLEELILNKTGVGHKSLCAMMEKIEAHPQLYTIKLSRVKNAVLRKQLQTILTDRKPLITEFNDYRDDVKWIRSVYR